MVYQVAHKCERCGHEHFSEECPNCKSWEGAMAQRQDKPTTTTSADRERAERFMRGPAPKVVTTDILAELIATIRTETEAKLLRENEAMQDKATPSRPEMLERLREYIACTTKFAERKSMHGDSVYEVVTVPKADALAAITTIESQARRIERMERALELVEMRLPYNQDHESAYQIALACVQGRSHSALEDKDG